MDIAFAPPPPVISSTLDEEFGKATTDAAVLKFLKERASPLMNACMKKAAEFVPQCSQATIKQVECLSKMSDAVVKAMGEQSPFAKMWADPSAVKADRLKKMKEVNDSFSNKKAHPAAE